MTGVAWYDIKGKGWWRDFVIILHPPYTLWHLSYVPIGAALAPEMNWPVLGWTVLAFFLGMGIGGHCLDELNGRPLRTQVPGTLLWTLAVVSILGAIAIGVFVGVRETVWVIPCIVFGGFIVFAYNLEWPPAGWQTFSGVSIGPPGFFHRDIWFGIAWGGFPAITAYVAQTHTLSWAVIIIGIFAVLYSICQRVLSTQARYFRRKVAEVEGRYYLEGETPPTPGVPGLGEPRPITRDTIIGPADLALKYMTWSVVAVAVGLLLMHV